MLRTALALTLAVSAAAAAQTSDDWNTFPPTPTPAPQPTAPAPAPAPAPKPQPAPTPNAAPAPTKPASAAPAPAAKPAAPVAKPAPTPAPKPAPVKSAGGEDFSQYPVVAQKETYEAGTEPHSPSTWGNAWNAPENARVGVGQYGIGTLLLPSARLGRKGVVRVSFLAEYFNQKDFPVKGADDIRSGITFAASFQPFEWGEVFLAYGASANTNNKTSPNLLQALGDLTLGVKASHEFFDGFWAGVDLRLLTFSGVGNQGLDHFAFGFKPAAVVTYDWRALSKNVPLLTTLVVGGTLDSTSGLVSNQTLNASEQFALGVNEYHRFDFGLAVEVPLPVVTPFVEYAFAAPLGLPSGGLLGPDNKPVTMGEAMAQRLDLGLKVTAVKDLTVTTGVTLGLAQRVGLGVPATAPWNFYLSAAFAIDPFQRGETRRLETVREKRVEAVKPPPMLSGVVTDAQSGAPLADVVVVMGDSPRVASDAKGAFTTHGVSGRSVKLLASREGYKPAEQTVELPADASAELPKVRFALEPDVQKATFTITTVAAKKPVKAQVTLTGDSEGAGAAQLETVDGRAETQLPAGKYSVVANAEGFLSQTRDVQVMPGGTMVVAFELVPVPKKTLVVFKGDKIEILQQVHFQSGKSVILADSFNLLQQVVDAVIKNGIKRMRVEGHTDNRGRKPANQKLSEDRAEAVMRYLIDQGIDPQRLESAGYGDSKPVAPNLTARGRELNRRVEFIVLER